jgi:tetratricopeptide (TPR) repeat protein
MIGRLISDLLARLRRKTPPPRVFDPEIEEARALLGQNRRDEVVQRMNACLARHPDHADARFLLGLTLLELERPVEALPQLEHALRLNPRETLFLYNLAVTHYQLGNKNSAIEYCMAAVAQENFLPAHGLWARIELPGDIYLDQLRRIHEALKPRTYLEIGVFKGQSLRLANPRTRAIGIDPAPQLEHPPGPRQTVHAIASDDFFVRHDIIAELGGERVELAFIDGMHLFEYALRDFINIERLAKPDSIVLVHDCYPLDRQTSSRNCETLFWSGDVWRLIPLLKKYRPDLSVNVIAAPPTGLGIIRGLNPESNVLRDRMDEIVAEFMDLDYTTLEGRKAETLNRYPNEWPRIAELLRPAASL